ncbi:hypothetical protein [Gynuella sunshinyii]|uniref:Uncharacterized protein n=1 Tax=Gynuella sunshinyii YC6258 TaxID=1445510 RepID=A0A0C5VIL2_9GAMM|nr:hypothetical protein [Gynuella sunshinyii]AJQ94106.1 hypothetical Protein YC6258_02062 [Gynuella sunshinyii YC6258]
MAEGQKKIVDKIKQGNHGELISSGFWLSQVFMLVATVLGVYLAAQTGLKQAIIFDDLSDKQEQYYLRHSLYDEVMDNVSILKDYDENFLSQGVLLDRSTKAYPDVGYYVWETMKNSPATLEIPSYFISETRRFYSKVEFIIRLLEQRKLATGYASKMLRAELVNIEPVLQKLKQNLDGIALELKQNDIIVTTDLNS